jgi:hypothetical protein
MIDPQSDAVRSGNGPNRSGAAEEFSDHLVPPTVMDTLAEQEDRMREFIRSHPLSVVFGALALGFVVARTMREALR